MSTATLPEPKALQPTFSADDEALYEVVNGEQVELPLMSIYANLLSSRLFGHLWLFVDNQDRGFAVCEALFILDPINDLRRRPDVAFVSKERWPLDKPIPETGDWLVVPDLVVEVISPNDLYVRVYEKLKEYFAHGVRQVWIVMPNDKEVLIHTSTTESRTLTMADVLDGGDIIPGFQLSLAELFKQPGASSK